MRMGRSPCGPLLQSPLVAADLALGAVVMVIGGGPVHCPIGDLRVGGAQSGRGPTGKGRGGRACKPGGVGANAFAAVDGGCADFASACASACRARPDEVP